ncbi:multicopper oxidase [Rhizophagus irregularis DAOM 181602=DAOM 197198]|nr:multicopper oxidase [Rhizophagus irregularis DAOM 181602=DAOM 197198]
MLFHVLMSTTGTETIGDILVKTRPNKGGKEYILMNRSVGISTRGKAARGKGSDKAIIRYINNYYLWAVITAKKCPLAFCSVIVGANHLIGDNFIRGTLAKRCTPNDNATITFNSVIDWNDLGYCSKTMSSIITSNLKIKIFYKMRLYRFIVSLNNIVKFSIIAEIETNK